MADTPNKRRWFWRVLPYAVAAIAIAAILWKYPPSRIAVEMQNGDMLAMAPFAALLIAVGIFIVGSSDFVILVGAVHEVPRYLQAVRARAAVSLLGMLGYGAGIGGFGVWLARATGCGAKLATGVMLYEMSADLVAVSLVATGAIYLGRPDVSQGLRIAAPAVAGVLLALKVFGPFGPLPMERLPTVFHPWRLVSSARALAAVGLRAANILYITVCVWLGANAFGMDVPLAVMATYFPIILVVGSMPVNVGGFGAVQGAWLLLEPWAASGEQVIAFSVLWQLVIGACIFMRGFPFVRAVTKEIEAEEAVSLAE
jgi:hypothetical protein